MAKPVQSSTAEGGVLLTGFDAFGGLPGNPSWSAVRCLHGERIGEHRVTAALLPTAFGASATELMRLMDLHRPVLVVCVGVARGRLALSLERIAINLNDARIPDNAGTQPVDEPLVPGGPAAYFSSLPVRAMLHTLSEAGIAAEMSQTAGTFVCNHVFYHLMHRLANQAQPASTRGGFIHVPDLPVDDGPGMTLGDMVRGLRLAVESALTIQLVARPSGVSIA